jgi:hypothetical protein
MGIKIHLLLSNDKIYQAQKMRIMRIKHLRQPHQERGRLGLL